MHVYSQMRKAPTISYINKYACIYNYAYLYISTYETHHSNKTKRKINMQAYLIKYARMIIYLNICKTPSLTNIFIHVYVISIYI